MTDNNKNINAFTVLYDEIVDVIYTDCGIKKPFNQEIKDGNHFSNIHKIKAIWDTGATTSVISKDVVKMLELSPIGKIKMFHAFGCDTTMYYAVSIFLPNKVVFPALKVVEGILNDADILIGMDIISMGDFAITSSQGKTKFSFQIPSTHDTDFQKEINKCFNNKKL